MDIDWEKDVREDKMRAGGPGGQKVNKTESAIRLTHLETGITVHIQDEKSQHKNRSKARNILASRLPRPPPPGRRCGAIRRRGRA